MNNISPVVVFVYSRPEHTKKMLSALSQNSLSECTDLIIYSDGAKSEKDKPGVYAVRQLIRKLTGFRSITIVEQEQNVGLAQNIIQGVTKVVKQYGRVIVLEDDIITSPYFLKYMNDALDMYADIKEVASISGSSYPVTINNNLESTYLLRIPLCWGWATWDDRWRMFKKDINSVNLISKDVKNYINFDGAFNFFDQATLNAKGKLNTWFIFWYITLASHKWLTLFPSKVMAKNIGYDGTGENCNGDDIYKDILIDNEPLELELKKDLTESYDYYLAHLHYFRKNQQNFIYKIYSFVKKIVKKRCYGTSK
ncbi:TPA: hypothetical protein RVT89_000332 [Escherichia coli]|nr:MULTISPECIES: hypothetical protein [Escherichia]EEW0683126.1 sugar transferase [Escherichia coli]EEZ2311778.1 sugar transferase [Escherichia coli]EFC7043341.1 sugar transferase [Escherichia coli]EFH8014190.1 sugar transferase [Escherichia coli]EFL6946578.1 sugar transferase [Escherichia coli]